MVKNRRKSSTKASIPKVIVISVIVEILTALVSTAMIATLISTQRLDDGAYTFCVLAALGLSAYLGAYTAVRLCDEKRWISLIGSVSIYYVLLILANSILFDGTYPGLVWGSTSVLGGAGMAYAAAVMLPKSGKKNKVKYRYR